MSTFIAGVSVGTWPLVALPFVPPSHKLVSLRGYRPLALPERFREPVMKLLPSAYEIMLRESLLGLVAPGRVTAELIGMEPAVELFLSVASTLQEDLDSYVATMEPQRASDLPAVMELRRELLSEAKSGWTSMTPVGFSLHLFLLELYSAFSMERYIRAERIALLRPLVQARDAFLRSPSLEAVDVFVETTTELLSTELAQKELTRAGLLDSARLASWAEEWLPRIQAEALIEGSVFRDAPHSRTAESEASA